MTNFTQFTRSFILFLKAVISEKRITFISECSISALNKVATCRNDNKRAGKGTSPG
jgi:hypothetical protein